MSENAWDYLEREIKKEVDYYKNYCDISSGLTKHAGLIYALEKIAIAREMHVKEIEELDKYVLSRYDELKNNPSGQMKTIRVSYYGSHKAYEKLLKIIRPKPERSSDE